MTSERGQDLHDTGPDAPTEAASFRTFKTPSVGTTLGPYQIVSLLGAGGMGVVYQARDARLERDVAIKFLPPQAITNESARKRFRQEALALAKVNHQNIAAVYDVGESSGADYLVMEYVPGQSLAQRLKSGPIAVVDAASLGVQAATALQEAHDRGIVHRDLKPANIILTPKGQAKVLDFGLAKLASVTDIAHAETLSGTKGIIGTPLYMSPEQAGGAAVDARTDVWSLGAVLYESLAGRPPFDGNALSLFRAITEATPTPVRELRPDVPEDLARIVTRALEKDRTRRYQSAVEMASDLSSVLQRLSAPPAPAPARELRLPLPYAIPAAILLVGLVGAGAWFYHQWTGRVWAREQAIPRIAELQKERKALEAFFLLKQAERYLPGDARLAQLAAQDSQVVSITSSPSGATVEIKDYLSPTSAWYRLGATPLTGINIAAGHFRWRVSKPGVGEYVSAPETTATMNFDLDKQMAAPAGMSLVDAGTWGGIIGFIGMVGPFPLAAYYIDRNEVTNREYQKFVDAGAYQKREYWTTAFMRDGREMTWEDAMALFRDSTGRPGPSTWQGGHYAAGQDDYPVSGLSWHEASAYAAFVGKSLPALAQWYPAAIPRRGGSMDVVQDSNISKSQVAPVGSFPGLGPYGTYDMAGNVREWALTDTGTGTKFILGGAWHSQTYMFGDPEALSPFDRSPENGLRCVRNTAPLSAAVLAPVKHLTRDFSRYTPVSDDVFRAYLAMYAYDRTPLEAKEEGVVAETDDWREEKITFNAAYDADRMAAYLFVPKHVRPPYQTVVFSPSARILNLHDSSTLGDIKFFDYIVQSGRAVLYPVLYGMYERQAKRPFVGAGQTIEYLTKRSKDLGRSLDYLDARPDIAKGQTAYLGVSMGSAEGVIFTTVSQSRLKAVILLDGGFFLDTPHAGGDQADFAPRLRAPVLMVNGKQDFVFSVEQSQDPLFRMLGAPPADKQHVVFETPHDVTEARPDLVKVVLGWLDKYLGRID
ncbi:MAG TPA: protein kinase [Vicinamibacterales bacterium]|nr:protein kinase [Vicinamibacterales bacterium]